MAFSKTLGISLETINTQWGIQVLFCNIQSSRLSTVPLPRELGVDPVGHVRQNTKAQPVRRVPCRCLPLSCCTYVARYCNSFWDATSLPIKCNQAIIYLAVCSYEHNCFADFCNLFSANILTDCQVAICGCCSHPLGWKVDPKDLSRQCFAKMHCRQPALR